MKHNIIKVPTPENPVAAVSVAGNAAVLVTKGDKNAQGLSPTEALIAKELSEKCPGIVLAAGEVRTMEMGLLDKYFALCIAIRESQIPLVAGASRGLNRREVTLLLKSLGYTGSRISEINRVVEAPPALWQKYKDKAVGFRAVLQLARGKESPGVVPGETEPIPGVGDSDKPGVAPVLKVMPKFTAKQQSGLVRALAALVKQGIVYTKGDDGYELTYEYEGRKMLCRLWVDKI